MQINSGIFSEIFERLLEDCSEPLQALMNSCLVTVTNKTESKTITLVLTTKKEEVAIELAEQSKLIYEKFQLFFEGACSVFVVYDVSQFGEKACIIKRESTPKTEGYCTKPLLKVPESQLKKPDQAFFSSR